MLILNRGRVAAQGTVAEVARRAAAPAAAGSVSRRSTRSARCRSRRCQGCETAAANGQPGSLRRPRPDGRQAPGVAERGVRALLDARIPLLSFELEGARLSDAFLAMTEAA